MKDETSIGHPFIFPTQVALVDDDQNFLEGISLMLSSKFNHKLFSSAIAGLDYLNTAHQHTEILERCYASYKTGPLASDSLTHIDINKLHQEVMNPQRFNTVSTLVIDYSMPEMNGLEFLSSLKNPFVKKILLTGKGDTDMAVNAFNSQLIDQFIDKHDPNLKCRLNEALDVFQDQYFRNSFKIVTDQILANNHDGFIANPEFQNYFCKIRRELNTVEYYMTDKPGSGFLLVDANGKCTSMLIHTENSLNEHCNILKKLNAPSELLSLVQQRKYVPNYDDNLDTLDTLDINSPFISQWQDHYQPASIVKSKQNYYIALFPTQESATIKPDSLLSFNTFQRESYPIRGVIH